MAGKIRLCPHGERVTYCRTCRIRTPWAELTPEQRRRAQDRSMANVYLRRGKIERRPCVGCGSTNAEMHHEDYSKPLDVTWLCRDCHMDHHDRDVAL